MAFVLNDRVKETTTTTGTGTVNLGGAATGFETFVAGVGNSNSTYYCIAGQTTAEFEVGIGTVTDASPDTLSRTTILSSSNSDSAVDFSAGTKDVFCTLPAAKTIREFDTAVNIPTGTTAQRSSSAAAGDFRYNTSTGRFEGYSSAWNALGGSNTFSTDIFAGDGSDTTFTLSQSIENENDLFVFIDGVFQAHNSYSVSGTTLTFSTAPANSRVITAYSVKSAVSGNNVTISTMDGDGSDTTLTLAADPVNENNVQVYIDGVYQNKDTFAVSGTTLTFSAAPPNGTKVEAITLTQTNINTATQLADADGDTKVQVEESSDEDKIRFDIAGTEEMVMDATGIVINDGSNNRDFRIESNGQTHALFVDGGLDNIGIGYSAAHTAINKGLVILTGDGNGGIQLNKEDGSYPSSGETLGSIGWKGADSANSNAAAGASIVGIAAEDFSGSTEATNLAFNTKPSGTGPGSAPSERMRIDSAGNVGIGATSPDCDLHINGATNSEQVIITGGNNASRGLSISTVANNGQSDAGVIFNAQDTENASYPALIYQTGGSERMRIDGSGNVGIGTSSPDAILETSASATGNTVGALITNTNQSGTADSVSLNFGLGRTADSYIRSVEAIKVLKEQQWTSAASTVDCALVFSTTSNETTAEKMRISSSGIITSSPTYAQTTSNSANMVVRSSGDFERSTSSRRYKNTITDATKGLEELKALRPVNYKGNNDGETVFYGLIAEEVHDAGFTEFVEYNDENEPDALRYPHMVALCIKAIQEQQTLIETLQAKVEALENG